MKLASRAAIAIAAVLVLMVGSGAQAATTSNPAPITFNDNGPASPYSSNITVSGATGTVTDVNVTITGLSHTWPADIDIMLVGPGGQAVRLMSDAGGFFPGVSNVNLTFDDAAPTSVPAQTPVVSGSYKPTNVPEGECFPHFNDDLPTPAPAGPGGSALSVYNGLDPNGTWKLFAADDCGLDVGNISGGWSLNIRSCILPEVVAVTDQTPAGPVVAGLLCT